VKKAALDARIQSGSVYVAGNSDAEHGTADERDQKQEHPSPSIANPHRRPPIVIYWDPVIN
jgi:hypothetical protein